MAILTNIGQVHGATFTVPHVFPDLWLRKLPPKRAKIIWRKLARYVSYCCNLTAKTAVKHYTVNEQRILLIFGG